MKKTFFTILIITQSITIFAPPKKDPKKNDKGSVVPAAAEISNQTLATLPASDHSSRRLKDKDDTTDDSCPPLVPQNTPHSTSLAPQLGQPAQAAAATDPDDFECWAYDDPKSLALQLTSSAKHCLQTAQQLAAQFGIFSRIKYFNQIVTSQQALADFIASNATAGNANEGYHHLQNAMLEAIESKKISEIKAALDLFAKIHTHKSCLTHETLKTLADASVKYQEHLDSEMRLSTLAYLEATRKTTFLRAEANAVGRPSEFEQQSDEDLARCATVTLSRLRDFSSKNLALNQRESSDDNDDDDNG